MAILAVNQFVARMTNGAKRGDKSFVTKSLRSCLVTGGSMYNVGETEDVWLTTTTQSKGVA